MFYFEDHEECKRFDRVVASVDIVAHKNVFCLRDFAPNSEQFEQIRKLSVDVAHQRDRRSDRLNIGFLHENFFNLRAELAQILLAEYALRFHGLQPLFNF